MRPYLDLVAARIAKNAENPTWATCDARWGAVVDHAMGIVREAARGVPGSTNERTAAEAMVKLGAAVEPREAVQTILAMFMMRDLEARRFRSDEAFRRQLVRRVVRLGEVGLAEWRDHCAGRTKRTYRDFVPGAADVIAGWVVETFGVVGLKMARLHRDDIEKSHRAKADLHEALGDLS